MIEMGYPSIRTEGHKRVEAVVSPDDWSCKFSVVLNNPYFTRAPSTTYTHGSEINKVTVTDQIKNVMSVTTRVVSDREWLNDRLTEETYDWYAQDNTNEKKP